MKKIVLSLLCVLILSLGVVSAAEVEPHYHVIEAGDTLRKLADRYETTVLDLLDLNPGITPDKLQIGEKVVVPFEPLWSYHVVQPGDNAKALATWYKVPLEALLEANGLRNNKLTVGDTIRVPMHHYLGEAKPTTHTVEIGDTLYKIAKRYEITLSKLIELNKLEDADAILAGQILIVS